MLLNDPTYVEAARALAARVIREGGPDAAARLDCACRLVLGRDARPAERECCSASGAEARAAVSRRPGRRPGAARRRASAQRLGDIDPAELAAWTSVARVLLNLHETITRN